MRKEKPSYDRIIHRTFDQAIYDAVSERIKPHLTDAKSRLVSSRHMKYIADADSELTNLAYKDKPDSELVNLAKKRLVETALKLADQAIQEKQEQGHHILLHNTRFITVYNVNNTKYQIMITAEVV